MSKANRRSAIGSSLVGMLLYALQVPATPVDTLLISEVFYDRQGSDNGFEWVELFNGTAASIDLAGWSLGYGGNGYAAGTAQLMGVIGSGDYFLVGGPASDASNAAPLLDQMLNFSPDLQNSGETADGLGLFDVLAGTISALTVPFDAVLYGRLNSNGLIDETGLPGLVDVADAPSGLSIERLSVSSWVVGDIPSPGTGVLEREAARVSEPPTWMLSCVVLGALLFARRFTRSLA